MGEGEKIERKKYYMFFAANSSPLNNSNSELNIILLERHRFRSSSPVFSVFDCDLSKNYKNQLFYQKNSMSQGGETC